jgi:hypothetical protein
LFCNKNAEEHLFLKTAAARWMKRPLTKEKQLRKKAPLPLDKAALWVYDKWVA